MSEARVIEVETFCRQLVSEYLPEYTFSINKRLKRAYGKCNYIRKFIQMSWDLAAKGKDEDILNNIVHEIAHGMHEFEGHSENWRKTFIKLGGDGRRTNHYEGVFSSRSFKYQIVCSCGQKYKKYYIKPEIASRLWECVCKNCRGNFTLRLRTL